MSKMFDKDGCHLSAEEICLVFGKNEILEVTAEEYAELERQIIIGNQEHEKVVELWKRLQNAEQALTELEELRRSDESKEQSSIDYFNEFKRVERELEELKAYVKEYFRMPKAGEIYKNPLTQNAIYLNIMRLVGVKDE